MSEGLHRILSALSGKMSNVQPGFCPTCGESPETKPHLCPFKEDVDNDYETLCTCCANCEYQCSMSV